MKEPCIKAGDFVFINGGNYKRVAEVKTGARVHLGCSGTACTDSLIGLRFGEVVELDHTSKRFIACNAYPDLDYGEVTETEERDNRNLIDNNCSQRLRNDEVAAIRRENGLGALLDSLVQNSATFHHKTQFSKEKYLRKKKKKYGVLFKVERVTVDNLCETHLPTINPSDNVPEDTQRLRLRTDTAALILHHSDVHEGSRVLTYDRTNGILGALLLGRIGDTGKILQLMEKSSQPNTFVASRLLGLGHVKERWKAIPHNAGFLQGVPPEHKGPAEVAPSTASLQDEERNGMNARVGGEVTSQWLQGVEARRQLLEKPADSLIVVDDEHPERHLTLLLPFLAYGGHIVVYSPFLSDLTDLFPKLRSDCVNICISESWYRHYQVLPQRTHPTVNMSTAAGYLLTAIRVERNPHPRSCFSQNQSLFNLREDETKLVVKRRGGSEEHHSAEERAQKIAKTEL